MSAVHYDQSSPQKIRVSSNGRPKPCLKPLPLPENSPLPFSSYPLHSPHVHFPPTPTLTSTTFTHSAVTYDRAPIMVTENVCALPERGGRCYISQSKNKSSKRVNGHCPSGIDDVVDGAGTGRTESSVMNSSEPKGSYFHPRSFEVTEPEAYDLDHHAYCNKHFVSAPSLSTYSSSSDSSISSEADSDSDSSYGSLSPLSSSSIPCAVVDSLTFGEAPLSAYPSDSSFIFQQQNGSQPLRQSYQQSYQLSHIAHYPRPSSPILTESKLKTVTSDGSSGRKAKGSRRSVNTSRLAKFGGGFSDQSMVLEGCLGGF